MIERSVYVRNDYPKNDDRVGMVTVIEEDGRFGIGWSLCNRKDKFDKVEAKFISRGRALKDYQENTRWFKDIQSAKSFKEIGINLPKVKIDTDCTWMNSENRIIYLHDLFDYSLRDCIREIIYTCALEYLRGETTNRPER